VLFLWKKESLKNNIFTFSFDQVTRERDNFCSRYYLFRNSFDAFSFNFFSFHKKCLKKWWRNFCPIELRPINFCSIELCSINFCPIKFCSVNFCPIELCLIELRPTYAFVNTSTLSNQLLSNRPVSNNAMFVLSLHKAWRLSDPKFVQLTLV